MMKCTIMKVNQPKRLQNQHKNQPNLTSQVESAISMKPQKDALTATILSSSQGLAFKNAKRDVMKLKDVLV
jgi:hypothetical protein